MKTLLLFILFLIPMMGFGQVTIIRNRPEIPPKNDTVKVVLLVSDTTHHYNESIEVQTCKEVGCPDSVKHGLLVGYVHYKIVKMEWGSIERPAYLKIGYSVRKFHYGDEWKNESSCFNCPDYWQHLYYLGSDKKPLPKTVIVWNCVERK